MGYTMSLARADAVSMTRTRRALEADAARHRVRLLSQHQDLLGDPGDGLLHRPGLLQAIRDVTTHNAAVLMALDSSQTYSATEGGAAEVLDSEGNIVLSATQGSESAVDLVTLLDGTGPLTGDGYLAFFMRGVRQGTLSVYIAVRVNDETVAHDSLRVTVVSGNLVLHHGLLGQGALGGQAVAESDEYSTGAVTAANLNDTDCDQADEADGDVLDGFVSGGDLDLCKVMLERPDAGGGGHIARARIRVNSTALCLIWPSSTKGESAQDQDSDMDGSTNHTLPLTVGDQSDDFGAAGQATRWAEMTAYSEDDMQTVEVIYEVQPTGEGKKWLKVDRARATAIWAVESELYTAGDAPATCDAELLLAEIADWSSGSSDDFGWGHFTMDDGVNDALDLYGARILHEFEVYPPGACSEFAIVLDVTRQGLGRAGYLDGGNGEGFWHDSTNEPSFPSPDSDAPTDDALAQHIDADPRGDGGGFVYIFDTPSWPLSMATDQRAFYNYRSSFRNFVRMRLGSTASFGNNSNWFVQGSRISPRTELHAAIYLMRTSSTGDADDFSEVVSATSISVESAGLFAASGRSISQASLLPAGTSSESLGFTLTYGEGPPSDWVLQSSTPDSAPGLVDAQGEATVAIQDEVQLDLSLGGGTRPADDAGTTFALFRTSRVDSSDPSVPIGINLVGRGPLSPGPLTGP